MVEVLRGDLASFSAVSPHSDRFDDTAAAWQSIEDAFDDVLKRYSVLKFSGLEAPLLSPRQGVFMARFHFVPTTLKELLTTRYFNVPRYQRSYSWTADETEDFWQDVVDAADDASEYFLGNVVLTEHSADVFSIIDGQQRIATTTILLASMRDHYRKYGRGEVADAIQNIELYPLDTGTYEKTPRVQLNAIDNQFYREYILESQSVQPENDSHRLIAEAKAYFDNKLDVLHEENPDSWTTAIGRISTFLKNNARIVSVYAASDADAFVIFETLNDRGADLTIADLLKNYLFSKSDNEINSVQVNWMEANSILDEYQSSDEFITFLRHFWSSVHGMTRERAVSSDQVGD